MKRILPFVYVLIIAVVFVAIASQTEQGAVIRARIQKRVQDRLEADLPKGEAQTAEIER
jgi:hypothetical protein